MMREDKRIYTIVYENFLAYMEKGRESRYIVRKRTRRYKKCRQLRLKVQIFLNRLLSCVHNAGVLCRTSHLPIHYGRKFATIITRFWYNLISKNRICVPLDFFDCLLLFFKQRSGENFNQL